MTPYEAGFAEGERASWDERGRARRRIPPRVITTERERGFWDGYTPRNPEWSIRHDPRPSWEREAA